VPTPQPAPDALLKAWLQREPRWAAARTPHERLEVLTRLENEIHGQLAGRARGAADKLNDLAQLYDQLVEHGILVQARDVPAEDRPQVLEQVRQQLIATESEATRLASEAPPGWAEPLRHIAAKARDGDRRLQALL
jgi:hypothetical protein